MSKFKKIGLYAASVATMVGMTALVALATTTVSDTQIIIAPGAVELAADGNSHQAVEADANVPAGFGTSTQGDSAFGAAVMGNLLSDANLTATENYLAGVIGHYTLTGTVASTWPKGAVLAGIGDDSNTADGAFVAYIDGDGGGVTTAEAAFKVMNNNSTPGNVFTYGLDLSDGARDGFPAVSYGTADIRLSGGSTIRTGTAVPTACGTGDIFIDSDSTNSTATLYLCDSDEDADGEFDPVTVTD